MRRRNLLARLFRALAGDTQKEFAKKAGLHAVLLAHYERGHVEPSPDHLARLAAAAGLTVEGGEQILELADSLRQPRRRGGAGIEDLGPQLSFLVAGVYRRLLRLPPPEDPQAERPGS
ncbi:MAG TPA: helix-turn-helix transcriptional regulator [Thermoanaerobaculia bacterium]|jgi:transcriptional regulator with XRE-family HTH domain